MEVSHGTHFSLAGYGVQNRGQSARKILSSATETLFRCGSKVVLLPQN
jgi:hypothetical protein